MSDKVESFREWAIIELMGHQRMAGMVSEVQVAGAGMIRVDVPACDGQAAFTRFVSPAAVYAINPVTEEIARGVATRCNNAPVHRYELPALPVPSMVEGPASPASGDPSLFENDRDGGDVEY